MLGRLLTASRYIVLIAVFGSLLAAVCVLILGAFEVFKAALSMIVDAAHQDETKHAVHALVEIVDLFLLGTVLYIVALGLYQLFIDDRLSVPPWLKIETLDQLKSKLLGAIVLSLTVLFFGFAAEWDGTISILYLGGAIALVITALSWSQRR
jgi:uncharacterized membrane protein YqhA